MSDTIPFFAAIYSHVRVYECLLEKGSSLKALKIVQAPCANPNLAGFKPADDP